jgi:hypothetical protein
VARRSRHSLIVVVVGALAIGFAAGGGAARAQQVDVSAKVTFVKHGFEFKKLELLITRNGKTWRSGSLGTTWFRPPTVRVRDLDRDGELEVLLDTFTGGAHCCLESRFFRYLPDRGAYAGTLHNWGNGGYRAKNIDGRDGVELVSNDDRFAYAFTAFAASAFPLQIWHLEEGRLLDVTRNFPGEVKLDSNGLWRLYEKVRGERADVRGVLAAWLADECLLGREEQGWTRVEAIRKRGLLGPDPDLAGWPQGSSYVRELRVFLRKFDYID